ncbi:alpha-hydroxy-acid oxidizing enzyme [Nocardiopsis sp. CNR-923]|uniref:alpha-hydroxy acid oxidase n=1 Tax=Nocardiopsis sp. CNR-923 TaxID=1904965 RepID=UPI00095A11BF|nr:alpha-hydroxy acid oxidase [Nocardiopsis sp. CNR-923]OLT24614.1 alpha-hydroxy-acid oxidizing enzyme [Nocardiopsis sp. CNR-923]
MTGVGTGGAPAPTEIAEFAERARSALSTAVWDFVAGGSTEPGPGANEAVLEAMRVVPRVLTGAAPVTTRARVLGGWARAPLAVAPMAYQCLLHPDGEVAAAAAAHDNGVPYVVSTLASRTLEDIAGTGAELWFQLYWVADEGRVRDLVDRARDAGCRALVLSVDVPVMARRPRDVRNGFRLPPHVRAALLQNPGDEAHRAGAGSAVARHTNALFHPALTWDHVERLRNWWEGPLVVKGVLDPRDAVLAADHGAEAVVVSNHGARQFGAAPAACTRIGPVAGAVAGRCEVLFDSGVRSGMDVLRALVLGASGVLVGRPVLWGLAADGQRGVARVLEALRSELAEALTLAGCADLASARELRAEGVRP